MPGPAVRILIAAAVSVLALVGLVVRESLERQAGTEVILRMEAVDPRALLSGHYVAIRLNELLAPATRCPPGTVVPPDASVNPDAPPGWVALAARGDHASVVGAGRDRATAARYSPLVARGNAACSAPPEPETAAPGFNGAVSLDLGVDRFHVSQQEAEAIDALLARRRTGEESPVAAIVSIGRDGRARLKGLVVEGRRMELSLLR